MKKYIGLLTKNLIFQGIPQEVILCIITSDSCHIKNFPAGKIIYESGQQIRYAGIVLEGTIDIVHTSASGHDTIVSRITPGGLFGESLACSENINLFNDIRSITESKILFIDIYALLHQNKCHCEYRMTLIENILRTMAKANVWLNTKMLILSQKTLRDKILTYFETLAARNHSNEFVIPFNREQLANFLGSERSSICRELSRMQEEKILKIEKDYVILN